MKNTKLISILLLAVYLLLFNNSASYAYTYNSKDKILIVISSDSHGYWLPEVLEPYRLLQKADYQIDLASPNGSVGKMSGSFRLSSKDKKWFKGSVLEKKLKKPLRLEAVNSDQYQAIYFAGGAGPMFDLIENKSAQKLTKDIYENGGIVSADCHGPAALINVRLSNGERLIEGRNLTAKANIEEGSWARRNYRYLLEDKITELGGHYSSGGKGSEHVVVDGRLITGQNPASAIPMTKALILALDKLHNKS